jgi:hypothetical protein
MHLLGAIVDQLLNQLFLFYRDAAMGAVPKMRFQRTPLVIGQFSIYQGGNKFLGFFAGHFSTAFFGLPPT